MRLEARKYLFDIQRAAESIEAFCRGRNFEQYRTDELLRIPDYRKIIAFRNIIVHGYASVDERIVWGVIEADLSALRTAVASLLAEVDGP